MSRRAACRRCFDLFADDAGAVVLDDDEEAVVAGFRERAYLDEDVGEDACLFAGVERVVHGFLDGGEQRLAGVVETEEVAVFREELRDGDLAL